MRKTTAMIALGAMLTACSADVTDLDEMSGMNEEQTEQSESEETTEEAVQEFTPLGLGCSIFVFAAGLVATNALCPRATTPQDKRNCDLVSTGGFGSLGILCAFM